MIITCEQCQARFRMADEKLKPGGTKVRCSKCKHVFTVLPPEPEPAGETVDYGDFNMERVADEETAPAPAAAFEPPTEPTVPSPPPEPVVPAPADNTELDFSGLEASMGPGTGSSELDEEFSFADTSVTTEPPAGEEPEAAAFQETFAAEGGETGELDFDATFAETGEPAAVPPAPGPAEFAFDQELALGGEVEAAPAAETSFDIAAGPEAPTAEAFDFGGTVATEEPGFDAEVEASGLSEFGFETEATGESYAFGGAADEGAAPGEAAEGFEFGSGDTFETTAPDAAAAFEAEPAAFEATEGFEFGSGDTFESTATAAEPAFGEGETGWGDPEKEEAPSFDFDEPSFETKTGEKISKGRDEAGLNFGEIDFSDEESMETPGFGGEPDFSQATLARPAEPEAPPPPPPPPPPRPVAERPRSAETLPAAAPRKSPMSRALLLLGVLLLVLCGAGGYFLFMGDGQKVIDGLVKKIKGEEPAAPFEQRIGLNITGSSYVNNREAGQLLVVQGTVTNNFASTRTAISVKGLLLDAAGKVLQQQTVFCGNYLNEEKLRTMSYAQIEESMNNQFGDSLSNMNVTPGKVLRFSIVFRNVPQEMANINVEVVDSKPGGT